MDLALKELGLTFIVGAIAVLGLEVVIYHFFEKEITGFLPSLLKREHQKTKKVSTKHQNAGPERVVASGRSMKPAVFIGLAFAVGLLSEDLSYKYVDTAKTPFTYIPRSLSSKLPAPFNRPSNYPDKETSRVETLIEDPWEDNMKVESLTVDLARTKAFSLIDSHDGPEIERWILENEKCQSTELKVEKCLEQVNKQRPSNDKITVAINRLYYYAKNRVYLVRSYYDEMSRIEGRRDFGRSIFLLSVLLLIISALIGAVQITLFLKSKRLTDRGGLKIRVIPLIPICLVLVCCCGLSFFAFERESDEFNKRAFGYFSAMLYSQGFHIHDAESEQQEVDDKPNTLR